jgi:ribosomal protein S4
MTAPSFKLTVGDKIELRNAKLAPAEVLVKTPAWIEKDKNKGKVLSEPLRDEIDEGIKENLIIEFYSR